MAQDDPKEPPEVKIEGGPEPPAPSAGEPSANYSAVVTIYEQQAGAPVAKAVRTLSLFSAHIRVVEDYTDQNGKLTHGMLVTIGGTPGDKETTLTTPRGH